MRTSVASRLAIVALSSGAKASCQTAAATKGSGYQLPASVTPLRHGLRLNPSHQNPHLFSASRTPCW